MSDPLTDLELIENSAFFDAAAYSAAYPDVAASGLSAAAHYLQVGGLFGRTPGPGFDGVAYLETYRDVAARRENPLAHFERHGRNEGRLPQPTPMPRDETSRVDVIVPVFNALEHVKTCLKALAKAANDCPIRVLVVDDGSDSETATWLRQACRKFATPQVDFKLLKHPENLGYTRAVNTGLEASDAPYVVTLNSDTVVSAHWLDHLLACLHSDPKIGMVGPLSNAASWQNVPVLRDHNAEFAINPLPPGLSVDQMAELVHATSARSYPRSTFLNGFCILMRRAVLDAIGQMDPVAFPMGYGEENDFCIRAQDAGFALVIADDAYVHHAKSKSFGSARRATLAQAGHAALIAKHGADRVDMLLSHVSETTRMDQVRLRLRTALLHEGATPATARSMITQQRVLFLLPVRGGGGGTHSVVQEVAAMRQMGVDAHIAVLESDLQDYLTLYADIENAAALFVPFAPDVLTYVASGYDVVVATLYSSVPWLADIMQALPWILPAYYVQDYEPLFYDKNTPEWNAARLSYAQVPGMVRFAKTQWICHAVEHNHKVPVAKVEPSLDHRVYGLQGPSKIAADGAIQITAMIRPSTPRRGAAQTMQVLAALKTRFGDRISLHLFGCTPDDPAFTALAQDFDFTHHGILTRPEVAALFRGSDMFVDLSAYQAFGRSGLEAMACGALAVVPAKGGADEYAEDGVNALVVDTAKPDACTKRIAALVQDRTAMSRMQFNGLETAARYSPRRAALSELSLFAKRLAEHRIAHPRPLSRKRLITVQSPLTVDSPRLPTPYQTADHAAKWDLCTVSPTALPVCKPGDVALVQGDLRAAAGPDFEAWLSDWKANGGRLIYDLGESPSTEMDRALAQAADLITLASVAQRDMVFQTLPSAGSKVAVVPTYLDARHWPAHTAPRAADAPLRIACLGAQMDGVVHDHITQALQQITRNHDVAVTHLEAAQITPTEAGAYDILLLGKQSHPVPLFWQAAAAGGAILCAPQRDLAPYARHSLNCLQVSGGPKVWQDALERLIKDRDLCQTLAHTARQEALENWTCQANAAQFAALLQKAVHGA